MHGSSWEGSNASNTGFLMSLMRSQAHSAQEVPFVEPVSHAVLQQSSSAQQASSALFGKEATPRHMQVPGTSRSLASKVIDEYVL